MTMKTIDIDYTLDTPQDISKNAKTVTNCHMTKMTLTYSWKGRRLHDDENGDNGEGYCDICNHWWRVKNTIRIYNWLK